MGSSCTSGKPKKLRNNSSSNSNTTKSSPKQLPSNIPSVYFHQIQKEQQDLCFQDKNISNKAFSKYLSADNTAPSNDMRSAQSSNSMKNELQVKKPAQTNSHSENNVLKKQRKSSQLENFILERKRYMQERGVAVYTPYTILPPPVLKSVRSSSLQQKRIKSLSRASLKNEAYQNKLLSQPASMHRGDIDAITVEI